MYRVYVGKMYQHDNVSYFGAIDLRRISSLIEDIQYGESQEAQRPLKVRKVREISEHICGASSISPNSVTIATNTELIQVKEEDGRYYIDFPEPGDEEYEVLKEEMRNRKDDDISFSDMFIGAISMPDGQHRMMSFTPHMCRLSDAEPFQMIAGIYILPDNTLRRKIFHQNSKQESISPSLRHYQERKLGIMKGEECLRYDIVEYLNTEPRSPLYGFISMNGEKEVRDENGNIIYYENNKPKKTRYNSHSLMGILKKRSILHRLEFCLEKQHRTIDAKVLAEEIINYLKMVESVLGVSFAAHSFSRDEKKTYRAKATTLVSMDMVLSMYGPIFVRANREHKKITKEFIKDCVTAYMDCHGDYKSISDIFIIMSNCGGEKGRMQFINEFTDAMEELNDDFCPLS